MPSTVQLEISAVREGIFHEIEDAVFKHCILYAEQERKRKMQPQSATHILQEVFFKHISKLSGKYYSRIKSIHKNRLVKKTGVCYSRRRKEDTI